MKVEVVLWEFEHLNVPIVVLPFFITTYEPVDHLSPNESVISIVYNPLQRVTDHVYCCLFDKAGCLNLTTLLESRMIKSSSYAQPFVVLISVIVSWPVVQTGGIIQLGIIAAILFLRFNDATDNMNEERLLESDCKPEHVNDLNVIP